ncbi:Uu.00g141590.m01.CDS01 [Anthostomella pinea]|uniref:Uu.00g141590.m01.CDS01 n=1 Tax=Anthostomella pinea TaxID=933095 RepID=A0AAI8VR81_9PEZI|nr:Uu.00g141590.m01.CDS01 [Anthostomella pinea]
MQFITVALSLFAAFAAAQNSTSTSLPNLVSELPQCALGCLNDSANSAGCAVTDFTCLCGTGKSKFINAIGTCVTLSAKCSSEDIKNATQLAPEICSAATTDPDPTAVASASNIVASAVASETASSAPGVPVRSEVGLGLLSAVAFAAFAL